MANILVRNICKRSIWNRPQVINTAWQGASQRQGTRDNMAHVEIYRLSRLPASITVTPMQPQTAQNGMGVTVSQ